MIKADSADELYKKLVKHMLLHGIEESTRAGPALVCPTPMIFCLTDPTRRVVQNPVRKPNHAFHISEAMWMLDGDNDGKKLDVYIHDFSSRFGEADGRIHDAYGNRWINHFGFSQIKAAVDILQSDSHSRQALISMWDPATDLLAKTKTRPCNLQLLFRINQGRLDMTVTNRSNDLVWGALGANIVHMTILQEVVAALVGVPLGRYYVMSNNLHMYKIHQDMAEKSLAYTPVSILVDPIVDDPSTFLSEVYDWNKHGSNRFIDYTNKWIPSTVGNVQKTFALVKQKKYPEARAAALNIACPSWCVAITLGLQGKWKKATEGTY